MNYIQNVLFKPLYNWLLITKLNNSPQLCGIKFITMKSNKFSRFIKVAVMAVFIGVLAVPQSAYAGTDNGNGNGGENNGHGNGGDDREGGGGGSVPVNGGIAILTLAGVAYCAKKFYDLKHPNKAVA